MSLFNTLGGITIGQAGNLPLSSSVYYPPVLTNATVASGALGTGIIYYLPFLFRKACTVVKIACENSGAGDSGDKCRMGWYASTDGLPSTLLQTGSAEVTFGGAAAINEVTISQAVIPNTLYFAAITLNASVSVREFQCPATLWGSMDLGFKPIGTFIESTYGGAFSESFVYGALTNAVSPLAVQVPIALCVKVTP